MEKQFWTSKKVPDRQRWEVKETVSRAFALFLENRRTIEQAKKDAGK